MGDSTNPICYDLNFLKKMLINMHKIKWLVGTLLVLYGLQGHSNTILSGRNEWVRLLPAGIDLNAKLDTGADISSLTASEIHFYKNGNTTFVGFRIRSGNVDREMNYPLIGYSTIKERSSCSTKMERRPKIKLPICIGNKIKEIDVNLTDRNSFSFPMLIGRQAMNEFNLLIDPSRTHMIPLICRF